MSAERRGTAPTFDGKRVRAFAWRQRVGEDSLKKVNRVLQSLMLALFALLLLLGIVMWLLGNPEHRSYPAALLLGAAAACILTLLFAKGMLFRAWLNRRNPVLAAAVLFLICVVLNGVLAYRFRPAQAPDFQTFWTAAKELAEGQPLSASRYLALFPHILGYSWFLSFFLRLFGTTLMTAALVNVMLGALTGLGIFVLCRMWSDTADACAAFLLWILCPSRLLYSVMCLSEPYYTCLLILFFLLVAGLEKSGGNRNRFFFCICGLLAGTLLRAVNTARPIGMIPVIALLLWLLLLDDTRRETKRASHWGLFCLLLLFSYLCLGAAWEKYATELLDQPPASVPGYSIYVGFNQETQGTYADSDMELLAGQYEELDYQAQAAQNRMLQDAKERIRSAGRAIPKLMLRKLGTLLGYDEGGVYYCGESLSPGAYKLLCVLSNAWYYGVAVLTLPACFRIGRRNRSALLLPLFAVGLILAQLLVEVAARYHYALIPVFLVMAMTAGPGSSVWINEKAKTRKESKP